MSSAFVTLDKKGRATLPEDVRAALGVAAGDFIILERTERGTYELVPAALVPKDQLWFYHPEMQARIRTAERSIESGRGKTTGTVDEASAFLDGLKRRPRARD
jgi:AbrB family looped-hinge helix DNA binding protein